MTREIDINDLGTKDKPLLHTTCIPQASTKSFEAKQDIFLFHFLPNDKTNTCYTYLVFYWIGWLPQNFA
jgi:hypothetical protein